MNTRDFVRRQEERRRDTEERLREQKREVEEDRRRVETAVPRINKLSATLADKYYQQLLPKTIFDQMGGGVSGTPADPDDENTPPVSRRPPPLKYSILPIYP